MSNCMLHDYARPNTTEHKCNQFTCPWPAGATAVCTKVYAPSSPISLSLSLSLSLFPRVLYPRAQVLPPPSLTHTLLLPFQLFACTQFSETAGVTFVTTNDCRAKNSPPRPPPLLRTSQAAKADLSSERLGGEEDGSVARALRKRTHGSEKHNRASRSAWLLCTVGAVAISVLAIISAYSSMRSSVDVCAASPAAAIRLAVTSGEVAALPFAFGSNDDSENSPLSPTRKFKFKGEGEGREVREGESRPI